MNHLVWRFHRSQAYFAVGALGALIVLFVVTGLVMAADYHRFLATCAVTQSCSNGQDLLYRGDGAIIDIVNATVAVPLLFGLFWGAPLVAKELEDGTHNLAWTQGVTRRHWLSTNVAWILTAAVVWGALISIAVSWWRTPENALGSRFDAFDVQGIAPIAYAVFAVSLGIAVGSLFRRVLPAIATTLAAFVAVRVAVGVYLRPHFLTPVTRVVALAGPSNGVPRGAWEISDTVVGPRGAALGGGLYGNVPAVCVHGGTVTRQGLLTCAANHGFGLQVVFQPANRFWAFQGIEAAFFVVLAGGLLALAYWRVLGRDA